jgi:hypothetical protein
MNVITNYQTNQSQRLTPPTPYNQKDSDIS